MKSSTKVLGIVGSYRRNGYIDGAVDAVLAASESRGAETRKIYLADFDIGFCTNCRECMQEPGASHVDCIVHHDGMKDVLSEVAESDAVVAGAPVNAGNANALTQRFVERCAGFYYWPWGTRGGPELRIKEPSRRAVLISSSTAPGFMNSPVFGMNAVHTLKFFARSIGARVVDVIKIGLITDKEVLLSPRIRRRTIRAADKLFS